MTEGTLILPEPFSLGLTLLCGQCFRWQGPDSNGWFQGVAGGVFWRLKENENKLSWTCSSSTVKGKAAAEWLASYLNLNEDLEGWTQAMAGDLTLAHPVILLRGLRLLRQEPWECTISYMFAQGLSVTVIRKALRKFCEKYGKPIPGAPGFFTFPEPRDLTHLTADFLRPFTNNYRARADRVIRLSRAVAARVIDLDYLKEIPCDQAREALRNLDGVGPKIADCILLFSMNHSSAFPVDRWVLRAMKKYFPLVHLLGRSGQAPTPSQYLKIVWKARKAFGEKCGLASEYLFLYLRLLEDEKLRQELSPFCQFTDRLLAPRQAPRSGKFKRRVASC
jgi:N-glycosylase/DNA lyase